MRSTPDGTIGMQVKLCDSLMQNVPYINTGDKLRIKITGDGTWMGKRPHVINIGYTIINEGRKAMSGKGNYCLGIVKMDENFESLSAFHDLVEEMENLSEIQINDKIYTCEYYLGGDWKFLACVCGLSCVNADHACIWCSCTKRERYDIDKEFSFSRTTELMMEWAQKKKYGCKYPPIFKFIPMDRVIIDALHLFLRITDRLISLLIMDLRVGYYYK